MAEADILVVEDAPEFAQIVTAVLRNAGHRVRTAATVADALTAMDAVPPDMVVLDLTLPDGDGLDLIAERRRERRVDKILVVSGRRDEQTRHCLRHTHIDGFYDCSTGTAAELGAAIRAVVAGGRWFGAGTVDLFVAGSARAARLHELFSPVELQARVRALLRRHAGAAEQHAPAQAVSFCGLRADPDSGAVYQGGLPLDLPPREAALLRALLVRLGCEVSDLGIVPDRREATIAALRTALTAAAEEATMPLLPIPASVRPRWRA